MNENTPLYRVIGSGMWIQEGLVASQAFRPRRIDNKMLSVYDGDQITPESAWLHYPRDPSNPPAGVLAVTILECLALDLPVIPDPEKFPEHVLIDFRAFGTNQIKRKSEGLRDLWRSLADGSIARRVELGSETRICSGGHSSNILCRRLSIFLR